MSQRSRQMSELSVGVVTPNLNGARFLKDCMDSVLRQGSSLREYIVIDGASRDASLDIIRDYEDKLNYWHSGKDKGQSEAINKGFRSCRASIVSWLNSDDRLLPDAVEKIIKAFESHPKAPFIHGDCRYVNESGDEIKIVKGQPLNRWILLRPWLYRQTYMNCIQQPATFFRRELLEKVGYLDETLHYSMDYDLWMKLSRYGDPVYLSEILAEFRIHDTSKTCSATDQFEPETYLAAKREWRRDGLFRAAMFDLEKITWPAESASVWVAQHPMEWRSHFRRMLAIGFRQPLVLLRPVFWNALTKMTAV